MREVAQVRTVSVGPVGGGVGVGEPEHLHGSGGVPGGVVRRRPGLPGVDGVAREQLGGVLHHLLGVAGAPADRVQLEQLPALVLVGRVPHRRPVVEVEQHRRVQRAGDEEVLEGAQRMGPDGVVVGLAVDPGAVVVGVDVQVVRPEADHVLEHLPGRVDLPQHRVAREVRGVLPAALGAGLVGRPLGGGRVVHVREVAGQRQRRVRLRHRAGVELGGEPPRGPSGGGQLREGRGGEAAAQPVQVVQLRLARGDGRGHGRRRGRRGRRGHGCCGGRRQRCRGPWRGGGRLRRDDGLPGLRAGPRPRPCPRSCAGPRAGPGPGPAPPGPGGRLGLLEAEELRGHGAADDREQDPGRSAEQPATGGRGRGHVVTIGTWGSGSEGKCPNLHEPARAARTGQPPTSASRWACTSSGRSICRKCDPRISTYVDPGIRSAAVRMSAAEARMS